MKKDAKPEEIQYVIDELRKYGLRADVSRGQFRTVIGLVGDELKIPFPHLAALPGVKEARMVETPYKLINREYNDLSAAGKGFTIKVGDLEKLCSSGERKAQRYQGDRGGQSRHCDVRAGRWGM